MQTPARAPSPLLADTGLAVIAHRGASAHAPENTLPAFQLALDMGADVIEMDLRLSADGRVVVIHDATVDRTTGGTGAVAELTLAELKALDAGSAFAARSGGSPNGRIEIPTLEEVLAAFPAARMMVELKAGSGAALADSVARILARHGAGKRVIVVSFDSGYLRRFRRLAPGVATGAGSGETARFYLLHLVGLHRWYRPQAEYLTVPESVRGTRIVTPRFLRAAARLGMEVHVWTVDDADAMRRLAGMGVAGILTNHPDRLRSVTPPPPPPPRGTPDTAYAPPRP